MNEYLQTHCATMGMADANGRLYLDRLYRVDVQGGDGAWRMRIVLVRTGRLVGRPNDMQEMAMPWSTTHGRRIDARKEAARNCLAELKGHGFYHANFQDVPRGSVLPVLPGGVPRASPRRPLPIGVR